MALDVRAAGTGKLRTGNVAGAGEGRAAHAGSAARISSGCPAKCGIAGDDSVRVRAATETAEGCQNVPVAPPVVPEKAKPAYPWDESAGID